MRTTAELREGFLSFYESKGHLRLPSASLVPPTDDPSTLLIVGRDAAVQAVLPRPARAAGEAARQRAEGAGRRDGHRRGRPHRPPSRSSRCSATSRSATTSRTARSTSPGSSSPSRCSSTPSGSGRRVHEGDPELGLGEDEVAIEAWKRVGIPPERIVAAPAQGQLLAGGRHRPVRAVLGDLLRPRRGARVRPARLPPGLRVRPLHGVLQPRLHAVRPAPTTARCAAAEPERRHRPRRSSAAR